MDAAADRFFVPLVQVPLDPVPDGFKSYVQTFLKKEDFIRYFSERGVDATRSRMGNPPLDLSLRSPGGVMSDICPLVNSSIDRSASTIEALFKLTESIHTGDIESTEKYHHLVSVGIASVHSLLMHIRRLAVIKENVRDCELTPKVLLQEAYSQGLFKVGLLEQPTLLGDSFRELVGKHPRKPQHTQHKTKKHTQRYVSAVQTVADPLPSLPHTGKRRYETRGFSSFDTFLPKKQRTLHVTTEDVPPEDTGFLPENPICPTRPGAESSTSSSQGEERARDARLVRLDTKSLSEKLGIPSQEEESKQPFRILARHGPKSSGVASSDTKSHNPRLDHGCQAGVQLHAPTASSGGHIPAIEGSAGSSRSYGTGPDQEQHCHRVFGTKIHLGIISGSKTGQPIQTDNRPFRLERTPGQGPFQDGLAPFYARHIAARRLDDKDRSKERLLLDTNFEGTPTLPGLFMAGKDLDVHASLFRPVTSAQDLHKSVETTDSPDASRRCQTGSLRRRFLVSAQISGQMQGTAEDVSRALNMPGICGQWKQNCSRAGTVFDFPGNGTLVSGHDGQSSHPETEQVAPSHCADDTDAVSIMLADGKAARGSGSDQTSLFHGPAVLQTNAALDDPLEKVGRPQVSRPASTFRQTNPGADVLDQDATKHQASTDSVGSGNRDPAPNGRCGRRVGSFSAARKPSHVRHLEHRGDEPSHKREGTPNCPERTAVLPGDPRQQDSSGLLRQHDVSSVHTQVGRCAQPNTVRASSGNLGNGPITHDQPGDQVRSGSGERDPRSLIQDPSAAQNREQGVATPQVSVPPDSKQMVPSKKGSVCKQLEPPTPSLHDMERKSHVSQRIPSQMEGRGLCIPSLCPDRQSSSQGQIRHLQDSADSTTLASTKLVHDSAINVGPKAVMGLLPKDASGSPGKLAPVGGSYKADGMASRWQTVDITDDVRQFIEQHELRPNTMKTYQNSWNQWVKWCAERNLSPSDPTVNSTTSYLKWLFDRSLSHSTINSAYSAMCKFCPEIGKLNILQHPVVKSLKVALYKANPPTRRYTKYWSPIKVAEGLNVPNEGLSLLQLNRKLMSVLSLIKPLRAKELVDFLLPEIDLSQVDVSEMDSITFRRGQLPKTQFSGPLGAVRYRAIPELPNLCPVRNTVFYMQRTKPLRGVIDQLFISSVKPYHHVSAETGRNWRKQTLHSLGIDKKYKGHSFRGAVSTFWQKCGVPMEQIEREGCWRTPNCLRKHYLGEIASD